MLGWIKSFLYEYYWLPIIDESVYYNPVNTITYALLFGVMAVYLIPQFFEKIDIEFDRDLVVSLTPFIFLGGVTRSLKDGGYVDTVLLETPIIYLILIGFALGTLFASKKISERSEINYSHITAAIGALGLLLALSLFEITLLQGLSWFIIISVLCLVVLYGLLKIIKPEMNWQTYLIPIFAHFWDASSTYVVLKYGGAEKHVLADYFIQLMGPKGMFLMKGLVIFPAVLYVNEEFKGEERNYYLFLIAMLGFALGTRNILSLITG